MEVAVFVRVAQSLLLQWLQKSHAKQECPEASVGGNLRLEKYAPLAWYCRLIVAMVTARVCGQFFSSPSCFISLKTCMYYNSFDSDGPSITLRRESPPRDNAVGIKDRKFQWKDWIIHFLEINGRIQSWISIHFTRHSRLAPLPRQRGPLCNGYKATSFGGLRTSREEEAPRKMRSSTADNDPESNGLSDFYLPIVIHSRATSWGNHFLMTFKLKNYFSKFIAPSIEYRN